MSSVRTILDQLEGMGIEPTGVADDSRQVQAGDLFLAYPGDLSDGRAYIADALARGAVAVLWQPGGDFQWSAGLTATHLQVPALRALAGPLAHAVYGYPSEGMSVIAITGTNGKTTISQCLARVYPKPCAVIGTLGAGFPGAIEETGFTTPEATTLMRYLATFRAERAAACALEASSIGIEEGRMNGLRVDVAVFTNLTRDHLDYHGSMEAYAAAKAKLFSWPRLRTAIINLNDEMGRKLARESTASRILGYAVEDVPAGYLAQVQAQNVEDTPFGQRFTLILPNGRVSVETALVGRYNIANLLAIAAVLHDAGVKADDVARRLSELTPPPGRMERVGGEGQPLVVVDYSHTPDALENALRALRDVANQRRGRLCVVFGCGGDRDAGKRPLMGEVAGRLADRVMVTSDNPRSEVPQAIIDAILGGMIHAESEVDRARAIAKTIAEADVSDVVLLAGKGHETYQEIAGVRSHFSDIEQALSALAARQLVVTEVGA
jgi:UDP-N-acetylmuramoyl-L-alanyl-D-glutamate--2,6-diaminopimelate ligase